MVFFEPRSYDDSIVLFGYEKEKYKIIYIPPGGCTLLLLGLNVLGSTVLVDLCSE